MILHKNLHTQKDQEWRRLRNVERKSANISANKNKDNNVVVVKIIQTIIYF